MSFGAINNQTCGRQLERNRRAANWQLRSCNTHARTSANSQIGVRCCQINIHYHLLTQIVAETHQHPEIVCNVRDGLDSERLRAASGDQDDATFDCLC
jgi:hypothetical protein